MGVVGKATDLFNEHLFADLPEPLRTQCYQEFAKGAAEAPQKKYLGTAPALWEINRFRNAHPIAAKGDRGAHNSPLTEDNVW